MTAGRRGSRIAERLRGEADDLADGQLVSRPTTFLFGRVDTLPLGASLVVAAMAQGATRRARGEAYVKPSGDHFGTKHDAQIVPEMQPQRTVRADRQRAAGHPPKVNWVMSEAVADGRRWSHVGGQQA